MPSDSHLYAIHGLTVSSEFAWPLVASGLGVPDVCIRYGDVPVRLDDARTSGVLFEVSPDNYLLRIDGVARYWVRAGREIVVEPAAHAEPNDIWTFLVGPA